MPNVGLAVAQYQSLKERILAEFPDMAEDDPALLGTLEGETNLAEILARVTRSILDDDTLLESLNIRIANMIERQNRIQARANKKRELVASAMSDAGLKKITEPDFTLSLVPGKPHVVITDEAVIPAIYMVQPPPPKPRPDKQSLAAVLWGGVPIPGAVLSNPAPHVTIRVK